MSLMCVLVGVHAARPTSGRASADNGAHKHAPARSPAAKPARHHANRPPTTHISSLQHLARLHVFPSTRAPTPAPPSVLHVTPGVLFCPALRLRSSMRSCCARARERGGLLFGWWGPMLPPPARSPPPARARPIDASLPVHNNILPASHPPPPSLTRTPAKKQPRQDDDAAVARARAARPPRLRR